MDIFSVTHKIRYWKNVRDLPNFKVNIENTLGMQMNYYVIKESGFSFDFDYTDFETTDTEIIFYKQEAKQEPFEDYLGWPSLTDEQIEEYYGEYIEEINTAKANYTSQEYSLYERAHHKSLEDVEIPEDFPLIDRILVTDYAEENYLKEIKRVKVLKYEV